LEAIPNTAIVIESKPSAGGTTEPPRWGIWKQIGFRFLFCYFALFGLECLSFLVSITAYDLTGKFIFGFMDPVLTPVVAWIGKHVLGMPGFSPQNFGSGGQSDYVRAFSQVLVGAIAALIWSFWDRKRPNYRRLLEWLRLFVQFILATTLFGYGFDKVFPNQFGSLTPSRMSTRAGDLSHFDLLWLFMAASKPYTIFSGALEALAGVLLLIPRLTTAGALLTIVVMTNVFALNLAYDVSVKLFSFQLLLTAIFLAWPEFGRLLDLLVLNRPVAAREIVPLSGNPQVTRTVRVGVAVLGCIALVLSVVENESRHSRESAKLATAPYPGLWVVDEFSVSGGPARPLLTSKLATDMHVGPGEDRWRTLGFDSKEEMWVELTNGTHDFVDVSLDEGKTHAEVTDSADPAWKAHLTLQPLGEKLLNIKGQVNGVEITARLHRDDRPFRLNNGEFHLMSGK
jgi:uncharacterized membrane protein YphA (DoxX/SURF4 family)